MGTIIFTSANGILGQSFASHFLTSYLTYHAVLAVRGSTISAHPNLHIHTLDPASLASVRAFTDTISTLYFPR